MSWQKCLSFSKCSNLEAKKRYKLYHQRDKKSDKQNLENKAVWMDLMHLKIKIKEKFKLKTKLAEIKI